MRGRSTWSGSTCSKASTSSCDNAQGFAYLVLATEDTQWGDLVAPRAREARALVEPQLSGPDLIHADALIGAYKQRRK